MSSPLAAYEIDSKWTIVSASETLCRALRCTEEGLIGRDVRDLIREDWRLDFRAYVARALVGVGEPDVTLPMVAPCGTQAWYKHTLEPILEGGLLTGYRAKVAPHTVHEAAPKRRWWGLRAHSPKTVWNFEPQPLERAS